MVQGNKQQNVKDIRVIGSEIIDATDRQIHKLDFMSYADSDAEPITCVCKFVMLLN